MKIREFKSPTQLPPDEATRRKWQALNKAWWENSPMRYDWRDPITAEPGSPAYFEEIDRRFFEAVRHYLPWKRHPFDHLINFEDLRGKDFLEIGVGYGSHAQLIAPFCKSFTGIDLTENGTRTSALRLKLFGIPARILCMDAERMSFPDQSFDFIWSWGVLHHSADTLQVLREMHRVLRPGGEAVVMVYYRSFWKYYVVDGLVRGLLGGDLWRSGSLHRVNQTATDGALARPYRPKEWQKLCEDLFHIKRFMITGQKSDLIPLPASALKSAIEEIIPDVISRTFTNRLRFGSFLIVEMRRLG